MGRARTKPVVPIYYEFLSDEEAGTTAIKADGTSKIVTVKTEEWFETHEIVNDGERHHIAKPVAAEPVRPRRPRRTKAQKAADDAALAVAKEIARNGNGHVKPVFDDIPVSAKDEDAEPEGRRAYDLASASEG